LPAVEGFVKPLHEKLRIRASYMLWTLTHPTYVPFENQHEIITKWKHYAASQVAQSPVPRKALLWYTAVNVFELCKYTVKYVRSLWGTGPHMPFIYEWHNVLYQVRRHFRDGRLHAALGPSVNFQCPIFWTAHLAWALRIPGIEARFNAAKDLVPFTFDFSGTEVHTHTAPGERILINTSLGMRNPSTGIFDNGLPDVVAWSWRFPRLPPRLIFSTREIANHTLYALRGFHFIEAALRVLRFLKELFIMFLPRYSARYGKLKTVRHITGKAESGGAFEISVIPATKYGTVAKDFLIVRIPYRIRNGAIITRNL